jgi:FMN phosphatase YigB (HAD superfamily)
MAPALFEIRNPHFSLEKVKALVFDLDDTLYAVPSKAQFRRFGEHLSLYLPENQRKAYLEELEASWEDGSPIKVGRAFDPSTGWVLSFDDHWRVKKAYQMDGKPIPQELLGKKYPLEVSVDDLAGLIHFSSGWGIPTIFARLRGLGREEFRAAYLATRKDMRENPEAFPYEAPRNLQAFLAQLRQEGFLLFIMTNAGLEESEDVLQKLGILGLFHKIYAEAKKPTHALFIFKEILQEYNLEAHSLLVVGDSVYNDLREAKKLGAQTVLIERFSNQPLGMVDVRIWDLEGLMTLWERLAHTHKRRS